MDMTRLWAGLHPSVREKYQLLQSRISHGFVVGATPTQFRLFETWRSPERQRMLYDQGNSKALPYHSAHQHGLAGDFVGIVKGQPSWDQFLDWSYLHREAFKVGLDCSIPWDLGHVEAPHWPRLRENPPWIPDYMK